MTGNIDLICFILANICLGWGHGGGQVVSVLTSNPADGSSFSVNFVFEKYEKEGGGGPFLNNKTSLGHRLQ